MQTNCRAGLHCLASGLGAAFLLALSETRDQSWVLGSRAQPHQPWFPRNPGAPSHRDRHIPDQPPGRRSWLRLGVSGGVCICKDPAKALEPGPEPGEKVIPPSLPLTGMLSPRTKQSHRPTQGRAVVGRERRSENLKHQLRTAGGHYVVNWWLLSWKRTSQDSKRGRAGVSGVQGWLQ